VLPRAFLSFDLFKVLRRTERGMKKKSGGKVKTYTESVALAPIHVCMRVYTQPESDECGGASQVSYTPAL
jgi:hypothetical protein